MDKEAFQESIESDDGSIDIQEFIVSEDDSSRTDLDSKQKTKKENRTYHNKHKKIAGNTKLLKPAKRKRKPKPADMPRRPLSAYNIFFQETRAVLIGVKMGNSLNQSQSKPKHDSSQAGHVFVRKKRAHRKTHGKISFSDLAKQIGQKWNTLNPEERKPYEEKAAKEKMRYQEELQIYRLKKKEKQAEEKGDSTRDSNSDDCGAASFDKEKMKGCNRYTKTKAIYKRQKKKSRNYLQERERKDWGDEGERMSTRCQINDTEAGLSVTYFHEHQFSTPDVICKREDDHFQEQNQYIDQNNSDIIPLSYHCNTRSEYSNLISDHEIVRFMAPLFDKKKNLDIVGCFKDKRSTEHNANFKSNRDKVKTKSGLSYFDNRKKFPVNKAKLKIVKRECKGSDNVQIVPDHEVADFLSFLLPDKIIVNGAKAPKEEEMSSGDDEIKAASFDVDLVTDMFAV